MGRTLRKRWPACQTFTTITAMNRIAVVDPQNRFLRWEERRNIHLQRLPHRSVHVLGFDDQGRIFLQRRHRDKQTYPRFWDNSVAGHVEESDYPRGPDDDLDLVYRSVAGRELLEELGVAAELAELGAFSPQEGLHYEHLRLYKTRHPGPFSLQPEEVEEGRWFTPDELDALAPSGPDPATPLLTYFGRWLRERGLWG